VAATKAAKGRAYFMLSLQEKAMMKPGQGSGSVYLLLKPGENLQCLHLPYIYCSDAQLQQYSCHIWTRRALTGETTVEM